jgi:hypothetical protein
MFASVLPLTGSPQLQAGLAKGNAPYSHPLGGGRSTPGPTVPGSVSTPVET